LRQLVGPFVFFLLALTGVIWLSQSLRFVDMIVNKGLSAGYFLYLSTMVLPSVLAIILPTAIFAAVLYTFHRLSADSEIIVMRSAGLGNWPIAKPAIYCALFFTLLGYGLTLYLMPLGQRALKDVKMTLRTDLSYVLLQEGRFNTIGRRLTVYVRERRSGGELYGMLVHDSRDKKKPATMLAERGALVRTEAGPRFVLVNGNRQQVDLSKGQLSLLQFDRYTLDLTQFIKKSSERWLEPGERYLHELFYHDNTKTDLANAGSLWAEAHDRLTAPFYALAFVMIGLAATLSGKFSRRGRTWRLVVAIAVVLAVRALGLGLVSITAKVPELAVLIYLNILVAIIGAGAFLLKGQLSRQRFTANRRVA
jgi:lipopolysaccharide export system permease protein